MSESKAVEVTKSLNVIPLFVLSFIVHADHLVVVPLSAAISVSTGIPITQSGLLVSIYPVSAAISAFVSAPFSDRFGRKRMLLVLVLGFIVSLIGCAFAHSEWSIFFFRILSGIFGGIVITNSLAYVGDVFTGNEKIRALSTIVLAFPIASILAVPLGAWLGDTFSWRAPFLVMALVSLICIPFLLRLENRKGNKDAKVKQQYGELLALWNRPDIRHLFNIQFFMLFGLFGFVPQISVWLSLNYDMSATEIGLCYMQGGIGAIVGNMIARHLLQKHSHSPTYKGGLISAGSLFMGVILFSATMEVFSGVLIGLAFAGTMFGGSLRMPALQVILSELVDESMRGRLLSMSFIVSNVTMGLGGFWSAPLLSIDDAYLLGMIDIGLVSLLTLALVPFWVYRFNRHFLASNEPPNNVN